MNSSIHYKIIQNLLSLSLSLSLIMPLSLPLSLPTLGTSSLVHWQNRPPWSVANGPHLIGILQTQRYSLFLSLFLSPHLSYLTSSTRPIFTPLFLALPISISLAATDCCRDNLPQISSKTWVLKGEEVCIVSNTWIFCKLLWFWSANFVGKLQIFFSCRMYMGLWLLCYSL